MEDKNDEVAKHAEQEDHHGNEVKHDIHWSLEVPVQSLKIKYDNDPQYVTWCKI